MSAFDTQHLDTTELEFERVMNLTNSSLKFPNVSIWFERALSILESFSIRMSYLLLLTKKENYFT